MFTTNPFDDDHLREECGVFGIHGHPESAALVALGLHALQHRGQEACGIASVKDERFYTERHQGLVGEAFGGADLMTRMPGRAAVGHTRYSTAGGSFLRNIQPMFADLDQGGIAIAHNGNLTNFKFLHAQLVSEGAIFQSTSDSEVILHLIAGATRTEAGTVEHQLSTRTNAALVPGLKQNSGHAAGIAPYGDGDRTPHLVEPLDFIEGREACDNLPTRTAQR